MSNSSSPITIPLLTKMKERGEKIVALTAYDAGFAKVLDRAGVDVILVGDSLGMVIQGEETTLSVTLDDMIYHTGCVRRGIHRALLLADLPFMTYSTPEHAAQSASRLLRESGARMVKLEGGRSRTAIIKHLVDQNIPVCGHLGLMPQSIHRLGGYFVQGRDQFSARQLMEDASILQDCGISLLVLECVPAALAEEITQSLRIPVIGIGAGAQCDGQVLVINDLLGIGADKPARFVKNFLADAGDIASAVREFVAAVREGRFPTSEHEF